MAGHRRTLTGARNQMSYKTYTMSPPLVKTFCLPIPGSGLPERGGRLARTYGLIGPSSFFLVANTAAAAPPPPTSTPAITALAMPDIPGLLVTTGGAGAGLAGAGADGSGAGTGLGGAGSGTFGGAGLTGAGLGGAPAGQPRETRRNCVI